MARPALHQLIRAYEFHKNMIAKPWPTTIASMISDGWQYPNLSMYGLMTTSCGRLKELKHVHAIKSIANEAYDESETSPQDGDQSKHMDESPSYVATFMQQPGRTVVDMPLSVLVALAESLRSDSYPMDDRISWAHRENKTTSTRTTCSPTRCATLTPSTRSTTAASWSRRTSGRGARGRRRSSCASRPARSRSVRPARRQSLGVGTGDRTDRAVHDFFGGTSTGVSPFFFNT